MTLNVVPNPAICDTTPEDELVARARTRDEAAVRELVRRCNQQMFRVARSIVATDSEAEDVVQAAYVAAFTQLHGFRGDAAFSTWVTRIVMNEAYGRLRRDGAIVDLAAYRDGMPSHDPAQEVQEMSPSSNTPETETGRAEIRTILEHAIDTLPEPFRLTYVLRDVQDMSTRDVALLLGVNPVTVKTRLFRARRLLRAELNRTVAMRFSELFPFDGARCRCMADRVIQQLAQRPPG